MTALYSVNLHVMGRSNISLLDRATLATRLHAIVPATAAWSERRVVRRRFPACSCSCSAVVFTWFLRTDFGTAMRAAGDNPAMITAQGVDRRGMVELALALANGLVAFSGALIAQYQGFADVTMGVGTLVAGMAAVILGETLKPRRWRLGATIAMVAVGAIVFRGLIALALRIGLNPDGPQARDRGVRARDARASQPRHRRRRTRRRRTMIELSALEKTFEQPGGDGRSRFAASISTIPPASSSP